MDPHPERDPRRAHSRRRSSDERSVRIDVPLAGHLAEAIRDLSGDASWRHVAFDEDLHGGRFEAALGRGGDRELADPRLARDRLESAHRRERFVAHRRADRVDRFMEAVLRAESRGPDREPDDDQTEDDADADVHPGRMRRGAPIEKSPSLVTLSWSNPGIRVFRPDMEAIAYVHLGLDPDERGWTSGRMVAMFDQLREADPGTIGSSYG